MRMFSAAVVVVLLGCGHASADTILYYTSTPGSWVGAGETKTIRPTSNFGFDFHPSATLGSATLAAAVHFYINDFGLNPDFFSYQWWLLDFVAPLGDPLTPGLYLGATRYPFEASSQPGISFAGNGRGNNMQTGYFRVFESQVASNGTLLRFAADFLQFDELQTVNYTWGSIRFNSDVAITERPVLDPVPGPPAALLMGLGLAAVSVRRWTADRYSRARPKN